MSLPAATAAFTAAFINHAEPANDASIGVLSFMDTDQLSRTSMFLPETDIAQDYIQLAQVSGEDILRGGAALLLCTATTGKSPEECLRDLAGRQQPGDVLDQGRPSNAGLRRVQDDMVEPSEIGDPRDITYYGDRQNRAGRWVSLWNVPVEGFGIVCAGTYDDTTHPTQSNMAIVSRDSCDVALREDRPRRENLPPVEIERPFVSYLGENGRQDVFVATGGDDSQFRFNGFVRLRGEGYPVAVTGRSAFDNETGCFEVESANDRMYERIDDANCGNLEAPYPYR